MVDRSLTDMLSRYGIGEILTRAVLVVDDDDPNLTVVSAVLEADYQVLTASSGSGALHLAESLPLDVIVADQRMPGMTGIELLERVRALKPDVAGIVLTGYTDPSAMLSAINKAHVFRFLTKPWEPEHLLAAVGQASERVFQTRAIRRLLDVVTARNAELGRALEELGSAQQKLLHVERLGTIGRLAAGVTHDLRNFLMGLVLLEQELQKPVAAGGHADTAHTVRISMAGIRNLLLTLETMNQFARSGTVGLTRFPVEPEIVVQTALTVMHMDMDFRQRTLVRRGDPSLPCVNADQHKLVQVFVNLLRNAVQATQPDQRITVEVLRPSPGVTRFAVEDEGPGVPPEFRERLFDAFVSTKGEHGMGMGLYMARLVAESHGGVIRCVAGAGGGARFELDIPDEKD